MSGSAAKPAAAAPAPAAESAAPPGASPTPQGPGAAAHFGALSGNPGGVPAPGGASGDSKYGHRFGVPAATVVAAAPLDPIGPDNKPVCRRCNAHEFSGKPWRGATKTCGESTPYAHVKYAPGTVLPKALCAAMCCWGGPAMGERAETHAECAALHDKYMAGGDNPVSVSGLAAQPAAEPVARAVDLGSMVLAEGKPAHDVEGVPESKGADERPKGLDALLDANGGPGEFMDFSPHEQYLADAISTRADMTWLDSPWHVVGTPSPGVARTLATGETEDFERRVRVCTAIANSRLITTMPEPLHGCLPGAVQQQLEQLGDMRERDDFTDDDVLVAALAALEGLKGSVDASIRRSAEKMSAQLACSPHHDDDGAQDDAHVGSAAWEPPADSAQRPALFARSPAAPDGSFTVALADGRGGVYVCAVIDCGDTVPVGGISRHKKCAVAAAAGAAQRSGFPDAKAGALLEDMVRQARESPLHRVPERATRTHAMVLDAHHSLTRLEVDHDLSMTAFDAFPPAAIAGFSLRSIDVGSSNILNVRQLRGRSYEESTPVTHALLLERTSAMRDGPNHALVVDFTPYEELHTAAGFDAWGARLRASGAVRLTTGAARGFAKVIRDSQVCEFAHPTSLLPKCPFCDDGVHGARCGDSGRADAAPEAEEPASSELMGGAVLASACATGVATTLQHLLEPTWGDAGSKNMFAELEEDEEPLLTFFDDGGNAMPQAMGDFDSCYLTDDTLDDMARAAADKHEAWRAEEPTADGADEAVPAADGAAEEVHTSGAEDGDAWVIQGQQRAATVVPRPSHYLPCRQPGRVLVDCFARGRQPHGRGATRSARTS